MRPTLQQKTVPNLMSGLTFIELIVVISIIAIFASVLLFNYRSFLYYISTQNVAQEIALQAAKTQKLAISGTNPALFAGNPDIPYHRPTYGLYFRVDPTDSNSDNIHDWSKKFVIFADLDASRVYDGDSNPDTPCGSAECIQEIQLDTKEVIDMICFNEMTGPSGCIENENDDNQGVSISFQRPFPDAVINNPDFSGANDVEIYIKPLSGSSKKIIIWSTGQVSIQSAS